MYKKEQIDSQALELNKIIRISNPSIYNMLSNRGKSIYFPKKGILGQTADAKETKINATIGIANEDNGEPMRLVSIEKNILLSPKEIFTYAPSSGKPELRIVWKSHLIKKNPSLQNKLFSLPVVTHAVTHGLCMIGYLFVNEDDHIIIPDLFWGNYKLLFSNTFGAQINNFKLFDRTHFNISSFRKSLLDSPVGKKIVILNFPNNPTGYTPTVHEVKEIVAVILKAAIKGNNIITIIDDAYFGLVYEKGIEVQSLFSYLGDIHKNVIAIKVDGATKEDFAWGLRVGFITYGVKHGTRKLYEALEMKTAGAIRSTISNVSHLSQSLILHALTERTYQKDKKEKYRILKKRHLAANKISRKKKYKNIFTPLPSNSGYFMCIQLNPTIDADTVRKLLIEKYHTGTISISNTLRIAFSAVSTRDIPKLFENIYHACCSLRKLRMKHTYVKS